MRPHYRDWNYNGSDVVALVAQKLFEARHRPTPLSPFVFMTDPDRVADPVAAVRDLPEGAAIIYRHFGRDDRNDTAQSLRQITLDKGQQFLIGNDPALAIEVGADGVHFSRDPHVAKPTTWRRRCPDWLISMAALKGPQTYFGDLTVLDGLMLSSVFPSESPSAGEPIGIKQLVEICGSVPAPVYALGGISVLTAPGLVGTGCAGVAGISGLT